jgi:uncharacterized protein (DUF58 family)
MIIGLARPQAVVRVPSQEGTIILTMDTSGSMQADDVTPNRMEAAKAAALSFLQHQSTTIRIGVVSFSDDAFVVQAPTADQDAVASAINRLFSPTRHWDWSGIGGLAKGARRSAGDCDWRCTQINRFVRLRALQRRSLAHALA